MYSETEYLQTQLSSVWPEWRIIRKLGKGTYGSVYEILRDDLGTDYRCALKVLRMEEEESETFYSYLTGEADSERTSHIGYRGSEDRSPSDRSSFSDIKRLHPAADFDQVTLRSGHSSAREGESILEDFVLNVSREIDLMIQLKGSPHIVSIEDYAVLRKRGQRTILIRMELLESLETGLKRTGSTETGEILRMGMDICTALEACEKNSILHRDIKISNIYYSDRAGYKLGDFGISRTMDSIHERMSMSSAGTIQYMAPEVYMGRRYNHTVDIYSLGMVLYLLTNGNLPPFCSMEREDTPPAVSRGSRGAADDPFSGGSGFQNTRPLSRRPTLAEIHEANMRRLRGEPLPPPAYADKDLASIICTACDPDSDRRFQSAETFRQALEAYEKGSGFPSGRVVFSAGKTGSGPNTAGRKYAAGGTSSAGGTRSSVLPILLSIASGILILFVVLSLFRESGSSQNTSVTEKPAETLAETGSNQDPDGTDLPDQDTDDGDVADQDPDDGDVAVQDPDDGDSAVQDPEGTAGSEGIPSSGGAVSEESGAGQPSSVRYTVIYTDINGKSLQNKVTGTGTIGEKIEVIAPDLDGYSIENDRQTLVLSENEQDNIVFFVYREASAKEEDVHEDKQAITYNTKGRLRILNKKYTEKSEFDLLASSFHRESGIDISVESPKTGKYSKTLSESLTGSSEDPTIFMLSGRKDFEKYGSQCLDLTDCAAAEELLSDAYALRGTNGRIYGLACIVESYGLAVNTDLLAKAGYSPGDLRSFSDLKKIAEDITSRKQSLGFSAFTSPSIGSGTDGYYRYAEHAPAVPLYYEVRDNSFNTGVTLRGDYMEYFKNYIDLSLNNSCVPPARSTSRSLEDAQQEFIRQEAVFHQDGSWNYRTLKQSLNANMAVIPLYMGIPGEENQGLCCTSSYFWCVNKYASADDIEAALQFLQWLVSSEDGLRIMAEDMDFLIPFKQAHAPDNLFLQTFREEEKEGKSPVVQYYKSGKYESWINGINNALTDYVDGTGSWSAVTEAFKKLW